MALPLFYATASVRLDLTAGSSSRAIYFALAAQYQFGTPIFFNRAPVEVAATLGLTLYSGVGDPGLLASVPGVVVVTFPYASPSVVVNGVAYPVSTSDPGGTLLGVNYVDANGVLHPDVSWQWQFSVDGYQNSTAGALLGRWDQQVVTWTGDGAGTDRLIPTTFDLTLGRVAVWVFSRSVEVPTFRSNNMAGSVVSTPDPNLTGGITGFQSGGFMVKTGGGANVNNLAGTYAAIVLRDTTTTFKYMRLGHYYGWPLVSGVHKLVNSNNGIFGVISPYDGPTVEGDRGTSVTYVGSNIPPPLTGAGIVNFVGAGPGGSTYTVNGALDTTPPGFPFFTATQENVNNRAIVTGFSGAPTLLWVFAKQLQMLFAASEMPVGNALTLKLEAQDPTNKINALAASVLLGTSDVVQGLAGDCFFVAFNIPPSDPVYQMFRTWTRNGAGTVPLGFQPAFAVGRDFTAGVPTPVWKSPLQTGTDSTRFGGTDFPTAGLEGFTSSALTVGATLGTAGDVYGFALAASGGVAVPAPPTYVPAPAPPYVPPGGPPGVPIPVPPGPGPGTHGCVATVSTGTGADSGSIGGVV